MIKSLPLGYERSDFVWRENFYRDPTMIRDWILKQDFESIGEFSFPGWQMNHQLSSDAIVMRIDEAMGQPIDRTPRDVTFGGVRAMSAQSSQFSRVHADTVTPWAAMVYLTPGLDAQHGTGFYRHLRSGLLGPPTWQQCTELGYESPSHFIRAEVQPDSTDPTKWEMMFAAPATYNAYIAFRGEKYFHAPLAGSGHNPLNARLTHQFFFCLQSSVGHNLFDLKGRSRTIFEADHSFLNGEYADFSNMKFVSVNFSHAALRGAIFRNCVFKNCNFSRTDLSASSFRNSSIEHCNFFQSYLYASEWRNARVDDASIFTSADTYGLSGRPSNLFYEPQEDEVVS